MIRSCRGLGAAVGGIVLVCMLLSGCAAGRTLDGHYVDEGKSFRVRLPRGGWQIIESPGADLALQDTRSQARMAVSAGCPARETGSLSALVRHLFFGLRHVKQVRQEPILLDGVAGLETVIRGQWEGAPIQVRSVVIRRKGCLYDLLFVAPPETFGAHSADFDALLEGWQFLSEEP
ncbi:MAG: hypothetical protein ACE5IQ_13935 [Candidatus Methylomirabilales bacterium]